MRELVEYLARALVSNPDEVSVEEIDENGEIVLEVRVADEDLGRVIGRSGRVANALRAVAKAAATHQGRRVMVEIVE